MLTQALSLEPDYALAIVYCGYALEHAVSMGWREAGPNFRQECISLARRGPHLAGGDATVMTLCGMTLIFAAKEYDWGMAVAKAALEANPNNMFVVMRAGAAHINCGDLDAAMTCFHRTLRLSPRDPDIFFPLTGIAHIHCIRGNQAEAFDYASRALALNPSFGPTLWIITASSAHLGRMEAAHRFLEELLKVAPDVTIAKLKAGNPGKDASRLGLILDGLRLAGLPEE